MTDEARIIDADYKHYNQASVLTAAPKYKRFLNFFIDYFICGTLLGMLAGMLLGLIFSFSGQNALLELYMSSFILKFALTLCIVILYYTTCEYGFQGKTIGKCLTKTRVVSCDGMPLSLRQIFLRSCARFLPFETISVLLGHQGKGGWHDQISKTMVVEEQKNEEIRSFTEFLVKKLA
ncbi:MAG: RDD family protein [Bacteroidota bacterium]